MRKLIDENINTQKLLRIACLLLADIVIINLSAVAALLLRFELSPAQASEAGFMSSVISYMWLNTLVTVIIFWIFGLYNSLWEFAGVHELVRIALASACSGAAVWFGMLLSGLPVPRSYPFIYILVLFVAASFPRFIYRLLRNQRAASKQVTRRRTMLIGGGAAGAMVIREFQNSSHSENQVMCVIDDNPSKRGALLMGVPIVGDREKIESAVQKYGIEEIVLAIPSAQLRDRTELISICQRTGCRLKTLPALYQLANGEVSVKKVRDVDIVDLLGRATVDVDMSGIADYIKGKTVLVTGGGGSIGSELCRQIAKHGVGRLIIFDIYENNAYDIQQELKRRYPTLDLVVLIGSVRDRKRVFNVMDTYRPELVFHAAAHKHVPLMEDSPAEAIKNNVFGTLNVAEAAAEFGAKRFLLIRQGREPDKRDGRVQAHVRDGHPDDERALRDGVCRGALRQRPRQQRQCDTAVPQADPRGRPRHRHRPERYPLFYDDTRSRFARASGRGVRYRRRDIRARHGRSRAHRRSRAEHDPALRLRARR